MQINNEIDIINKIKENGLSELTFDEIKSYKFDIHNLKANLKAQLEFIESKEIILDSMIQKIAPFEVDLEGKLLTTQIVNKDTGEIIELFEYKQLTKELFDAQYTFKTLQVNNPHLTEDEYKEFIYNKKLKVKPELKKILMEQFGLTNESIEACFCSIERSEPKIVVKKI